MSDRPPRIGYLAGWQVYDGATLERYLHLVMSGAAAAARDHSCDLLFACGVGPPVRPYVFSPAWPEPAPNASFVPVGPWNCDGLLVVPPIQIAAGIGYVRQLVAAGFPVVFAGATDLGPCVGIDNAGGIAAAVGHLVAHGHRAIAYLAGLNEAAGDSAERLHAFHTAMAAAGLTVDPRLVVRGNHSVEQGEEAMRALLASGIHFSAVVASNDQSAVGARAALARAGRRVPDDVALVGFDDLVEARVQTPPLTTVHHSPFDLGYQALVALLDLRAGRWDGRTQRNIPVLLMARQSCGCRPGIPLSGAVVGQQISVAQGMADALLGEARQQYAGELAAACDLLAAAFVAALDAGSMQPFQRALVQALRRSEALGEDAYIWHAALLALQQELPALAEGDPARLLAAERLISWGHLTISDRCRRQVTGDVLRQIDLANRVGTMTAQLLASLDEAQIAATLREHLGRLGIGHLLVALYQAEGDSPRAWCRIALSVGLPTQGVPERFPTTVFPPPALYPPGAPLHLAVLPLEIDGDTVGFAAFAASNLDPCATVVRHLGSALRTSQLYRDAAEGRRLAEEASQLKTRFLSMVSHELRTPLNVIVGLSEMALRDLPPAATPLHADLERIYASAQHLGQLIGDVLDLASSDAGQLRILREPLDLSEVLQMVAAVGEQMARTKGLAWHADLPQPGPQILGDRTRLRQIVLNLLTNAVKFTEHGSVALALAEGQGRAIITVRDSGVGVAPSDHELIFDLFRRVDGGNDYGQGGLGLGLAICRQLVALHGGQITVSSAGIPGAGASFAVSLPVLEAHAPLAAPPLPQDLLVIAAAGAPLAARLRASGYSVRLLGDITGLDAALAPPPGAILLDGDSATRHGAALTKLLQGDQRLAHIPLLVWAAEGGDGGGAVVELNLLPKPVSAGQLARAILREGLDPEASLTVLVVDDTAAIRALHARIVAEALPGARVIEARDGREALALLEQQLPDLMLLDLMMPDIDGFGVLEAMGADPRTRGVPVLVLTARPLDDADMARLQHGVAAILGKGLFSIEETVGHISAALQRQRRLSIQTRRLVRRALAFIHERYAEAINRDLIAAHVGVNENYLSECFHAEMGIPPMTYLTRYRISRARALLEQGDSSITAIAAAVGFSDSAYFSRVFQREVGMTPRDYRRRPPESR